MNTIRCNLRYTSTRIYRTMCRQYCGKSNKDNPSSTANENESSHDNDVKKRILEASLPYVNERGWSKDAIAEGAKAIGYPGVSHGMFAKGGADLVQHFQTVSNEKLVSYLQENESKLSAIAPPQFVEEAVRHRLLMIVPYLNKWPQALAIMSLPPNVPTSLASLLTMVDDICYYAGDRSVDFDWYARRIALAGVYKATELYMLQDTSPTHGDTWTFLNRRLTEAVAVHDAFLKSEKTGKVAREGILSAFITARNILGLNWNR